jgi:polysaccharide biosynthesis/export protein
MKWFAILGPQSAFWRRTAILMVVGWSLSLCVAAGAAAQSQQQQTPPPTPPAQANPGPPTADPKQDAKADAKQDTKKDAKSDAPADSKIVLKDDQEAKPETKPDAANQDPKQTAPPTAKPDEPPAKKEEPPAKDAAKDAKQDPKKASGKASGKDKKAGGGDSTFSTEMPANLNEQAEFTVGPGDILLVTVFKEVEVSGEVQVRGDCRITINLVKDLEVCGLTPTQIGDLITEKLSKFYTAPDVTVTLRQLNSRKVYFIGQVRRPGAMLLNGPMTVAQAINDAGGLTDFANAKKVVIQREENGKTVRKIFNYADYLKGKNSTGNILLKPGDTIIVR